jgi:hypothetical protein
MNSEFDIGSYKQSKNHEKNNIYSPPFSSNRLFEKR